jgi:hypothetical protein
VHRTVQDAQFDQVAESHQDYFQCFPRLHVPLDLCDPYKSAITAACRFTGLEVNTFLSGFFNSL